MAFLVVYYEYIFRVNSDYLLRYFIDSTYVIIGLKEKKYLYYIRLPGTALRFNF